MAELDLNTVKFDRLERHLSKIFSTYVKLEISIGVNRGGSEYLHIRSNDLRESTGLMANMYNYFRIENFGGAVNKEGFYWLPLSFAWEYKTNGSNGTQIGHFWWNPTLQNWVYNIVDENGSRTLKEIE